MSVIGLTNYFFFAENEVEIIREEISRQKLEITVIPNIELRVTQANKKGEWINIHLLFSEKVSIQKINDALSSLFITPTTAAGKKYSAVIEVLLSTEKILSQLPLIMVKCWII